MYSDTLTPYQTHPKIGLFLFGFHVFFNNLSVILIWCLTLAESSKLTLRVLPHWNITPQKDLFSEWLYICAVLHVLLFFSPIRTGFFFVVNPMQNWLFYFGNLKVDVNFYFGNWLRIQQHYSGAKWGNFSAKNLWIQTPLYHKFIYMKNKHYYEQK